VHGQIAVQRGLGVTSPNGACSLDIRRQRRVRSVTSGDHVPRRVVERKSTNRVCIGFPRGTVDADATEGAVVTPIVKTAPPSTSAPSNSVAVDRALARVKTFFMVWDLSRVATVIPCWELRGSTLA